MLYPDDLAVGLKEWDSVCKALMQGRQIMMLRKGGIHESGGEFELEFRRFLLFPTFLHQDKASLKENAQDLFAFSGSEPDHIQIAAYADVTDIVRVEHEDQINGIDEHHVWTRKLLQMRLNYRPENPLYILLLRVHNLETPMTLRNSPKYGGCKSWVGLTQTINVKQSTPALDPPTYQSKRDDLMMKLRSAVPKE
jgi:hypothetical protein